jgi:hypothetical protein
VFKGRIWYSSNDDIYNRNCSNETVDYLHRSHTERSLYMVLIPAKHKKVLNFTFFSLAEFYDGFEFGDLKIKWILF